MDGFPGPVDPIQRAIQEHQMRQQAQVMMEQALRAILVDPTELRTFGPHLMALRVDDEGIVVLGIALPSGVRLDFRLDEQFLVEAARLHEQRKAQ